MIEFIVPVIWGLWPGASPTVSTPPWCVQSRRSFPRSALLAYLVAPAGLLVVGVAIGLIINLVRPFYRAGIFAVGPRSLDPADLPRYNMRWTVSVQAGQIVGGAVAGAFLWAAGPKWAFLAAAVAYALAAYALASARSAISTTPDGTARPTTRGGVRCSVRRGQYPVRPVIAAYRCRLPDDRRVQCGTGTTCPPALRE